MYIHYELALLGEKEVLCVKYPTEFLAIIDHLYERFPFILPLYTEPPNQ